MNRVLEFLCFIIICTKIGYVSATNNSAFTDENVEWLKSAEPKNLSVNASIQDLYAYHLGNQHGGDETVRHFFPLKGKQRWLRKEFSFFSEMLLFNVSVIRDNEEVSLAQLHLHRRRLVKTHDFYHKRFLPSPYRVVLYQIQPNYRYKMHEDAKTMKLASLPVSHRTKGGWHTLDVTPVIRELLINAQGRVELLFGVQFEAPKKPDEAFHTPIVPIKSFLKNPNFIVPEHPHKSSCYLVVISETDPFFDDFEEEFPATTTFETPLSSEDDLRKRHFKHRIIKNQKAEDRTLNHMSKKEDFNKWLSWKSKQMENEVYKTKKKDFRHRSKNKGNEMKRSKEYEQALEEKTKLKLLPFLHANEVEEIRQTSRRLIRSSLDHRSMGQPKKTTNPVRSGLINSMEVQVKKDSVDR